MNTIKNIPGFTAEKALYNRGRKHNMSSSTTKNSSSGVVPQAAAGLGTGFGTGFGVTIDPEQCVTRCQICCSRYGCFYCPPCYTSCF